MLAADCHGDNALKRCWLNLAEESADELKGRTGEEVVAPNPPQAHGSLVCRTHTNRPSPGSRAASSIVARASSLMGDVALRWIVTVVFGASIATYVYILIAQHRRWTNTVNHLLHLAMSAAMILMAWGVGMSLPTVGPMIFFLLAGIWFARAAGRMSTVTGDRLTNGYYAVMMAAMAWMYAVMAGGLPGQNGHSPDHGLSGSLAMNTSGMDMSTSGVQMSPYEMSRTLPGPGWITTVNSIVALVFGAMALYWPWRHFAKQRTNPVSYATRLARLEPLCQALTAGGTALMFSALL
jgi:Domain of unknown function (DUF5134)